MTETIDREVKIEKLIAEVKNSLCNCKHNENFFKERALEIENELQKFRKEKLEECEKRKDAEKIFIVCRRIELLVKQKQFALSKILTSEVSFKEKWFNKIVDKLAIYNNINLENEEKIKQLELKIFELEEKKVELEMIVENLGNDKTKFLKMFQVQEAKLNSLEECLQHKDDKEVAEKTSKYLVNEVIESVNKVTQSSPRTRINISPGHDDNTIEIENRTCLSSNGSTEEFVMEMIAQEASELLQDLNELSQVYDSSDANQKESFVSEKSSEKTIESRIDDSSEEAIKHQLSTLILQSMKFLNEMIEKYHLLISPRSETVKTEVHEKKNTLDSSDSKETPNKDKSFVTLGKSNKPIELDSISQGGTSDHSTTSEANAQMYDFIDIFTRLLMREMCNQVMSEKSEVECRCLSCGCFKSSSVNKKMKAIKQKTKVSNQNKKNSKISKTLNSKSKGRIECCTKRRK